MIKIGTYMCIEHRIQKHFDHAYMHVTCNRMELHSLQTLCNQRNFDWKKNQRFMYTYFPYVMQLIPDL